MVTKRIRSEYMKNFKDPKWETYSRCYEEMLTYRLTRRLLEHTHNPWFWSGSDSDSDSGGRNLPHRNKNHVGTENRDHVEPGGEGEETRTDTQQDQQTRTKEAVHRLLVQKEEEDGSALQSTTHGFQLDRTRETKGPQREEEESKVSNRKQLTRIYRDQSEPKQKDAGRPQRQKTKPSRSTKQTRRSQQVRPAPPRQPREDDKESRHPFALYGSGEKDADIAGRKTHNVCPAASTTEIHESALRAKTRREVERQIQNTERRRAKSADPNKTRTLVQSEFNPWLTEYMRCFSARTR